MAHPREASYHERSTVAEPFAQHSGKDLPSAAASVMARARVGMNARQSRLDALRSLRERETESVCGWVLSTDVPPGLQQLLQTAAAQGLVELADREARAELSAYAGRPVLWAARLSEQGHDVLTYLHAAPAPTPHGTPPTASEQVIELRPAQMDALRVYANLAPSCAYHRPTASLSAYAPPTSTGQAAAGA